MVDIFKAEDDMALIGKIAVILLVLLVSCVPWWGNVVSEAITKNVTFTAIDLECKCSHKP